MFKKIFIALVALFSLSQASNAQVKFGLKGGLNVTSMSFSKKVFDASNKLGFFIGPSLKLTVPIVGLSFDVSALYDQKQADVNTNGSTESIVQKSINIPVNIRYGWGLSSLANVFIFAGPQWGINVGSSEFKWNDNASYSLKKSNFSINVGAGVTLVKNLQVTANYNIACGKSAEMTWKKVGETITSEDKSRNNCWQIALGYYF